MDKSKQDNKGLKELAQMKFNKEREKIEDEIQKNLNYVMRPIARGVYSGKTYQDIISLHSERINKLLKSKLKIYKEIFLNDQPVKTKEEINLIMKDLEKIANPQKQVILNIAKPVINRLGGPDKFKENIERNVTKLLSDFKRDLEIEKKELILLGEKEIKKVASKTKETQKFNELLKFIKDEKLREILLRDFENAIFCLKNELWKPCVILCGGILEGIFNVEFEMHETIINGKKVKMNLESMIDKAKEIGILQKKQDAYLAHAVRTFRNHVHIEREIKDDQSIDDTDAHISVNVVKKVFRMIQKFKEN